MFSLAGCTDNAPGAQLDLAEQSDSGSIADLAMLPGPPDLAPYPKHVFVTSKKFAGDFTVQTGAVDGADAADKLCTQVASGGSALGAHFGSNWKAWVSTSTVDAITRINEVGPWYNTDETRIMFLNKNQMGNVPYSPIYMDELGGMQTTAVWTGTAFGGGVKMLPPDPSGVVANKYRATCIDWTTKPTSTFLFSGADGTSYTNDATWTDDNSIIYCDQSNSIYCIEQ